VVRRRVIVHGRVQGVGFRWAVARAADARGVAGWVRNRLDGTVEAVFDGDEAAVESLVRYCANGTRGAGVTRVETFDEPRLEELRQFELRPTA
jgi:acylphosphatase